jgi:hypothetical protein
LGPLEFVFGLIFIGSVAAIARKLIEAVSCGGRHQATAAELRAAQDRVRTLEAQLVDARLPNDQLQKLLEWHTRMLETQDRLVKQLTDSPAGAPAGCPG